MTKTTTTEASNLIPPHGPVYNDKLMKLRAAFEAGRAVTPIVTMPDGVKAICGSHRIAAAIYADADIEIIALTELELAAVLEAAQLDRSDIDNGTLAEAFGLDWNDLCYLVYRFVERAEVRQALADQFYGDEVS